MPITSIVRFCTSVDETLSCNVNCSITEPVALAAGVTVNKLVALFRLGVIKVLPLVDQDQLKSTESTSVSYTVRSKLNGVSSFVLLLPVLFAIVLMVITLVTLLIENVAMPVSLAL